MSTSLSVAPTQAALRAALALGRAYTLSPPATAALVYVMTRDAWPWPPGSPHGAGITQELQRRGVADVSSAALDSGHVPDAECRDSLAPRLRQLARAVRAVEAAEGGAA